MYITDHIKEKSFLSVPYLTKQIIPYIGNKRRLLPLIYNALTESFSGNYEGKKFLDLFAGSGVVSRFAKYLGFEVHSNDWEEYSFIINYAYIKINKYDLKNMYKSHGGIENIIFYLNNLPFPDSNKEYIARYFSPKNDLEPDYKTERLFYTRYNGLAIDKIRDEIERLYPDNMINANTSLYKEKILLLAILLHKAATHTNTSGVFKAFHKGFGGFSKDALSRILKPIALGNPILIDTKQASFIYKKDANVLLKEDYFIKNKFDITYLDPPYNQHQYGSNYHLLNTIALWDKININESILINGKNVNRAGIRRDWVKTKSDYCYRDKAKKSFEDLIDKVNSRYILLSYSNEGIVPFEEILNICSEKGKLSIVTNEYIKYRGGKQSINRLNNNIEFILIIDTNNNTFLYNIEEIKDTIRNKRINIMLKKRYSKSRLKKLFKIDEINQSIGLPIYNSIFWIKTKDFFEIDDKSIAKRIDKLNLEKSLESKFKIELIEKLNKCQCNNKIDELDEILYLVKIKNNNSLYFISLIPDLLKKIAHKKYKDLFYIYLEKVKTLKATFPELYRTIGYKIDKIERLANTRFNG